MSRILDSNQPEVRLAVEYYDASERQKLRAYPTADRLEAAVREGVRIDIRQFLVYYLFRRKRLVMPGYRSFRELADKTDRAAIDLEDWVEFSEDTLVTAKGATPQDPAITERIGEAAALSLISHVHSLHEADWQRIETRSGPSGVPTFDFEIDCPTASDGERIVQVEAKGSAVADTSVRSANILAQKARLDRKKASIRELAGCYPCPADLRYGVIAALGRQGTLRCLVTDPPGEAAGDPRRYRLLARLDFMHSWVSRIAPRSQLSVALATRNQALSTLKDPFVLAGVPLSRSNGMAFEAGDFANFGDRRDPLGHLSNVVDGSAVGTIIGSSGNRLLFAGVRRSIFEMSATQEFDKVLSYKEVGISRSEVVRCVVPRARARRLGIESRRSQRGSIGPVTFRASGRLHYAFGASVFGWLERDS